MKLFIGANEFDNVKFIEAIMLTVTVTMLMIIGSFVIPYNVTPWGGFSCPAVESNVSKNIFVGIFLSSLFFTGLITTIKRRFSVGWLKIMASVICCSVLCFIMIAVNPSLRLGNLLGCVL